MTSQEVVGPRQTRKSFVLFVAFVLGALFTTGPKHFVQRGNFPVFQFFNFSTHGTVPMVFNGVVRPSRQQFRNLGPPVAQSFVGLHADAVFARCPCWCTGANGDGKKRVRRRTTERRQRRHGGKEDTNKKNKKNNKKNNKKKNKTTMQKDQQRDRHEQRTTQEGRGPERYMSVPVPYCACPPLLPPLPPPPPPPQLSSYKRLF